jgi:hypothetical protein
MYYHLSLWKDILSTWSIQLSQAHMSQDEETFSRSFSKSKRSMDFKEKNAHGGFSCISSGRLELS